MDKGREEDNGHRKKIFPIKDGQTQDVFMREL